MTLQVIMSTADEGSRGAVSSPGLNLEQASDGFEQNFRSFAFGQELVGKFDSLGCLRGRRDDKDGYVRLDGLHLPGNLGTRFVRQKVVGDHQVDGVPLEEFQALLARGGGHHLVARDGKQRLTHSESNLRVVNTE